MVREQSKNNLRIEEQRDRLWNARHTRCPTHFWPADVKPVKTKKKTSASSPSKQQFSVEINKKLVGHRCVLLDVINFDHRHDCYHLTSSIIELLWRVL